MRTNQKKKGFALILVLILVMVSAILGVTYLASASLKQIGAEPADRGAAHYLAESAVQHAMYICVTNPSHWPPRRPRRCWARTRPTAPPTRTVSTARRTC